MVGLLTAAAQALAIIWCVALTVGWWRLRQLLRDIETLATLAEATARRADRGPFR